jgi:NADH-quinone oxidoreductase subunit M
VILAAVYLLWMYQRVFFGKITNPANLHLKDLPLREIVVLAPLIVLIVWIGVYPQPFLSRLEPASARFIAAMDAGRQTALAPEADRKLAEPPAAELAATR